jgi:hypothetical protein
MNTNPILKDKCKKNENKRKRKPKAEVKKIRGGGYIAGRIKKNNVKKKFIIENYLAMLLNLTLQLNFETS